MPAAQSLLSEGNKAATMDALPYTSPPIVTILVLASYLLFLSAFYHAFQKLFSAGILGPLVLGAIYAQPLANILPPDVQSSVLSIGYLGLILLIVQGGLEARLELLSSPKNLVLSVLVGATGVALPVGISMALLPAGFGYGNLESFAIGAALASTSLGTTFAILGSFNSSTPPSSPSSDNMDRHVAGHGIANTRIGTILIGAALLDDVVGLVIIGVISTLGGSALASTQGGLDSIGSWTIARPIVSSCLLLVVSWLISRFALGPLSRQLAAHFSLLQSDQACVQHQRSPSRSTGAVRMLARHMVSLGSHQLVAVTLMISTVLTYSVISEEVGSSLLIGAFCSGAMMKYVYKTFSQSFSKQVATSSRENLEMWSPDHLLSKDTALGTVQSTILVPFFFSSVGSAIPVKSMFQSTTVWRGVIFAGLMAFAKVCAAGWIVLVDLIEQKNAEKAAAKVQGQADAEQVQESNSISAHGASIDMLPVTTGAIAPGQLAAAIVGGSTPDIGRHLEATAPSSKFSAWPASLFLGVALMSRGEIGFIVINMANRGGLLDQQAFNVAIWAIVLNTLAGPISIGMLMRTHHAQSILRQHTDIHKRRWA